MSEGVPTLSVHAGWTSRTPLKISKKLEMPVYWVSLQPGFPPPNHFPCRHSKGLGEVKDGRKRRVLLSALQKADVRRVISAVEAKLFLRDSLLLPDLSKYAAKRSFSPAPR